MKSLRIIFVLDKIGISEICTIPTLSVLAKSKGHEVELVDFSGAPKKACRDIASYEPDIICYSVCSNEVKRYLEINRILKKKVKFFSLFGGAHPTFFPDFIREEGVDAICRGEGDVAFPLFLDHFGEDKMFNTCNFSFKDSLGKIITNPLTHLVEDLNTLPFPDRDIVYQKSYFMARNPVKTFFAGRGCPFNCTYCFNHSFNEIYRGKGKVVRTKCVDYLFKEINQVREKYPLTFIKFHDDIFGSDSVWIAEFSERYSREIGLPFFAYARPNMINDEYVSLLKKAGCFSVCLAIECGNERIRNELLNRNLTNAQIETACSILKKAGLRIYTLNMIGLPGETDRDIFKTLEFNQRLSVDFSDASIFQPFPGTRINKYCKEKGYLDKDAGIFEGQYSRSILNFDPDFKDRIYIIQRFFSILVSYSFLKRILPLLFKMKKVPLFLNILNLFYRVNYGINLHRRVYDSKIPLFLRLRGSILLFTSKSRS